MMSAEENWEIGCSDDENYDIKLRENGKWEPEPGQIADCFERLASSNDGLLNISWVCPGRRPPTPEINEDEIKLEPSNDDKEDAKDDYFDFEIEKGELCLRPSGDIGPRGSAKKKTTSLDAILSNMARHRRMDMLDQEPETQ